MPLGPWILLAAIALALLFGLYRAATDGRFRGTHRIAEAEQAPEEHDSSSVLGGTPWEADLGDRATLLQFSSAFCAPCRATRRILSDVAAVTPGVAHLEVDAENHLDLVRRLGILRTPTTLVLDADGREVVRASGAPARPQVMQALQLTEDNRGSV